MDTLMESPTGPKVSARGYCRSGERQTSSRRRTANATATATPADSSSWKQKRHTRRVSYTIFLLSLWFCMLKNDGILIGRAVQAEGPILPSISSSLFSSSSVSKSKARIVIPSPSYHDEGESDIGDYSQLEITEESLSVDGIYSPDVILLREELGLRKFSTTHPVHVHRSISIGSDADTNSGDVEEETYGNSPPIKGAPMIPSPSRGSFKKTGTTIAGCVVPGGESGDGPYVILAADTRATAGTLVADKRCDKIHKLTSNCRCCGAGTSADLDKVTRQVLYQMALQELLNSDIGNGDISNETKEAESPGITEPLYPYYGDDENDDGIEPLLWLRPVSIEVLCGIFQDMLFRSGGKLGANLIVGGVWNRKAYLRAIHPHGSTDVDLPFTALGSGGLAAMAVLEEGYRSTLTLEDGIELVQRAILSGIRNDLGSGSQVDLCVIDPDGVCHQTRGVIPEEALLPDGERGRGMSSSSSSSSSTKDPSNRTNRLLELLGRGDENEDEDKNEQNRAAANSKNTNAGVNGFGNQPFAIENMKQRMVSVEMDRAKQKETWDRALGL